MGKPLQLFLPISYSRSFFLSHQKFQEASRRPLNRRHDKQYHLTLSPSVSLTFSLTFSFGCLLCIGNHGKSNNPKRPLALVVDNHGPPRRPSYQHSMAGQLLSSSLEVLQFQTASWCSASWAKTRPKSVQQGKKNLELRTLTLEYSSEVQIFCKRMQKDNLKKQKM